MISVIPCREKEKIEELFNKHSISVDEFSGCVIASQNEDEKRLNIDKLFGGCNCHNKK